MKQESLVAPKLGDLEGDAASSGNFILGLSFPANPLSGCFGLPIADKAACVH